MRTDNKQKLLISFSGGRTSAFMTQWLINNCRDQYDFIIVFANTGKEREETLKFINQCDKHFGFNVVWVEAITNPIRGKGVRAKVVTFETASRNGEPYEAMIAKHGIPSKNSPHCTRELKKYAINAYARSIGWRPKDYITAIGIRTDEADRIKKGPFLYPLLKLCPMDKQAINTFWSEMPFDLQLKGYEGNCNKCFKKSLRKLMTIEFDERKNGNHDDWWADMEDKYGDFIPESKKNGKIIPPLRFYRGNFSIRDIEDASLRDFNHAVDDSKTTQQRLPFGTKLLYIDEANGCSESCEVF